MREEASPGEGIPSGAPIQMNSSPPDGFECHRPPSQGPSITSSAVSGAISRSSRMAKRAASAPIPSPKNAEIRTRFEKYATMRIEAPSQRMSASSQKSAARPHRSSRRALASQAAGGRPSTASDGSSHMAA